MRRTGTTIKPSEADLEQYGTDLLALDGWRSLKTDPVTNREWGKGFGEVGMADRLYLRYLYDGPCCDRPEHAATHEVKASAQVLWIEWKRPGGKAKDQQRLWIDFERELGALVLLAGEDFLATPEGFLAWYRGSGLMRKNIITVRKPGA